MIIAAHIPAATPGESFLYNTIGLLAIQYSGTRFIFFVNEDWKPADPLPSNIECISISPAPKNGLLLHYWYQFKLSSLLKKHKVTHFIAESGAISLQAAIPQLMVISNISFLQKKPLVAPEHARYIKRYFPKFLGKASAVLVTEHYLGDRLAEKFPAYKEKMRYAGHGLNALYHPVDWEPRDRFLNSFSNGTEYFIAECSAITRPNILALLKAFSHFKKRLKSGMQLVLVLKGISINDCVKDFHLYKYRDDVKVITFTSDADYAPILAAAYGAIYLPGETGAENTGLHSLASGMPLITTETQDALSVYGEAALYTGLAEKNIAECMMTLYKEEELRKNYINKGLDLSTAYSWTVAASALWQALSSN